MSLETVLKRKVTECVCDNCFYFNIFNNITTFDSKGYMKYCFCKLEKKYVRFDWSCVRWKRKKKV